MRRCAVIGSPISHSLSPLIHRTAYTALGIADQFRYDAFEVTPETLDDFLARLGDEWAGLSVTAPNKQALLAQGVPEQVAADLQAGNTLIFGRDGQPNRVHNTDVTGMLAALARAGVEQARTGLLVGNGATARSALWAMGQLGVGSVVVQARDAERAVASLAPVAELMGVELVLQPYGKPTELPADFGGRADLLVQTAPAQLPPELAADLVAQAAAIFEVVYTQYPSNLDLAARDAGVVALDGLDLLVGQAIDQIALMTGHQIGPEPLLAACRAEVLRRQAAGA